MSILFNYARHKAKSDRLNAVIALVLARNQTLIVGTSRPQERYEQLKAIFPNANVEMVNLGVKVCPK
jgi:hypothetical protein